MYAAFNLLYKKVEQYYHSTTEGNIDYDFSVLNLEKKVDKLFSVILNDDDDSLSAFLNTQTGFNVVWLNFFSSNMSKYWFSSYQDEKLSFKARSHSPETDFENLYDKYKNKIGECILLSFDMDFDEIILSSSALLQSQGMSGEVFMLLRSQQQADVLPMYISDTVQVADVNDPYEKGLYKNFFHNAKADVFPAHIQLDKDNDKKKYLTWKFWVNNYAPKSKWTHAFYIDSLRVGALSGIDDRVLNDYESIRVNFAVNADNNNYDFNSLNVFISLLRNLLNLISNLYLVTAYRKEILKRTMNSAIAAIMARNMSHNIGSHVLVRLRQDTLLGDLVHENALSAATFDPMGLVIDDAYKALADATITDMSGDKNEFLRHRIGAAIHYLQSVHDQVDPNVPTGTPRQEIFAKDMKILSAYLQRRMDFIAQICTEWSPWTNISYLCDDVMAQFLRQSKVLQYIAASEKLTAARFHNGKLQNTTDDGRIKFVVRYRAPGEGQEFIQVMNFDGINGDKSKIVDPNTHIPVAFPGGHNGWQAFFVIIEGVMRNFAKHSYGDYLKMGGTRDLIIVIDVMDDNETIKFKSEGQTEPVEKPVYTVRVYSNVSLDETGALSSELRKKLAEPLISEQGELKKSNWGLAELRIATGYLRQADIMEIGQENQEIVEVKSSKDAKPPLHDFKDGINASRFFYGFKFLKPQTIGIETSDEKYHDECFRKDRKNEGWEVFAPDQVSHRMFEYYVLDGREEVCSSTGKEITEALSNKVADSPLLDTLDTYPGRLFVVADAPENCEAEDTFYSAYSSKSCGQLHKRVCLLCDGDWERLQTFFHSSTEEAAQFLQEKWVEHLLKHRMGNEDASLSIFQYINTEGEASGVGESVYIPDTTPYQVEEGNNKNPKIPLLGADSSSETHPNSYSLVFGRHWGLLEYVSETKDTDGSIIEKEHVRRRAGKDDARGKVLYAEPISGGSSYLSLIQHAFDSSASQPNRDILQLAEAALMKVVIVDERVQEGFIKADLKQLIGTAEQQVFIGYLRSGKNFQLGDFDQKDPEKSDVLKTGYITVDITDNDGTFGTSLKLHRELSCKYSETETEKELWKNPIEPGCEIDFDPDILIIHQGILDKWVADARVKITDETIKNAMSRFNVNNEANEKKAKIGLLIEALKKTIPHVIITSGRGEPDDKPKGVRFIPLSAFDAVPRGGAYEKYPLVQQVMSIVEKDHQ